MRINFLKDLNKKHKKSIFILKNKEDKKALKKLLKKT